MKYMNKQSGNLTALSVELLDVASTAARSVGPMLLEGFQQGMAIGEKLGFYDLVTEYDRNAEHAIKNHILGRHPDSMIVGEEGGAEGSGSVRWYVDPIDGTANFASGFPVFCVSIGAEVDGELVAGVIFDPVRNELFAANLDGAFLNGQSIKTGSVQIDQSAVLLTDYPAPGNEETVDDFLLFGEFTQRFRAVRRLGSAALAMAYVACGRADVTLALHINPWDVAAGYLLISQAGGEVLTLGSEVGRPWLNPGFIGYAGNFKMSDSILGRLRSYHNGGNG
jgi:myo-inositol-1(or 4)-monophosphatase